jgi:predicted transcriptional regulator
MKKWEKIIELFQFADDNGVHQLTCREVADTLYGGDIKKVSVALSSLAKRGYLKREQVSGRNIDYSLTSLYDDEALETETRKKILKEYEL